MIEKIEEITIEFDNQLKIIYTNEAEIYEKFEDLSPENQIKVIVFLKQKIDFFENYVSGVYEMEKEK